MANVPTKYLQMYPEPVKLFTQNYEIATRHLAGSPAQKEDEPPNLPRLLIDLFRYQLKLLTVRARV